MKSRKANNRYNNQFLYSLHLNQIETVIIMYSSHDETAQVKTLVHFIYHQLEEDVNPFVNNKQKAKEGSVCHKSKRDDVFCEDISFQGNKFHRAEGQVNIACVLLIFTSCNSKSNSFTYAKILSFIRKFCCTKNWRD